MLDRAAARYSETPSADGSPRQGAKASFDGRNVCQKCFYVTFDESNKAFAVSGTSYFHEKGRAIEKNHFRNAGSRLPQP